MTIQIEISNPTDQDSWVCLCGNTPYTHGFYACESNGQYVEPDQNWKGLYKCDKCGRIINGETRQYQGGAN